MKDFFNPLHVIVALVVWPEKLPELGLGEAIRGVKKALEGAELDNKQPQVHEKEKKRIE